MEKLALVLQKKPLTKLPDTYLFALQLLLLCIFYTLSGVVGLQINAVSGFATLIWIPSGISLAALLLFGYRLWPAITFGAFLVNIHAHASIPAAATIALGNTLEVFVATYILKTVQIQYSLQRLKDVLYLMLLAAPFGSAIAATIGSLSLIASGNITSNAFLTTWQAWFVGDIMSMILLTPFLLTWSTKSFFHLPSLHKTLEILFFLVVTSLFSYLIFTGIITRVIGLYLVFPLIVFAALRFSQRIAITTVLFISIFALTTTVYHVGPFGKTASLLFLQIFLQVVALTTMCLAAVNTERKEYEERKDEFISLASHELKTPLTSLKILTHLAQRQLDKKTGVLPTYMRKMDREIDRITSLTSSLLDISRIQAGSLTLQKEVFACIPFVKDIVETMQATTRHPIILKYNKNDIHLQIFADKARFSQVLINFLTNAMKYSPVKKRIIVTITSQKRHIIMSVKDSGIGISPEDQMRIFQRYFRGREEKQGTYPGLGLGLYIARQIVRQHNGKMWVKSTKGKGSTFFVSLPLIRPVKGLNLFGKKNATS